MIDLTLPLEFDDGRPVTIARVRRDKVYVNFVGNARRDGAYPHAYDGSAGPFYYHLKDGVFGGGSKAEFFVLRNAPFNDETLEWFE